MINSCLIDISMGSWKQMSSSTFTSPLMFAIAIQIFSYGLFSLQNEENQYKLGGYTRCAVSWLLGSCLPFNTMIFDLRTTIPWKVWTHQNLALNSPVSSCSFVEDFVSTWTKPLNVDDNSHWFNVHQWTGQDKRAAQWARQDSIQWLDLESAFSIACIQKGSLVKIICLDSDLKVINVYVVPALK